MSATVVSITAHDERLWSEFAAAAQKAQRTLSVEDGLAARRAWIAFMRHGEAKAPPAKVIPIGAAHAAR